ncbi:MAG: GNAT family N-acetyltransferase [Deltaproteobacteria bacterium]
MKDRQNKTASLQRVPSCDLQVIRAGSETTEAVAHDPQIAALPPGACNDKIIGRIVGSVRAYQKDDTCFIGKLVVLPGYQNQGIGKALMREIEKQFHNAVARYEIFTGSRDPRNRYLYDQLGYKPFRTERINEELTFVYMEKRA